MTLDTIIIDENPISRELLHELYAKFPELNILKSLSSYRSAFEYIKNHKVDFALINLSSSYKSEIEFGVSLRSLNREAILIYFVSSPEQCFEAVKAKADYCILKPFENEDIKASVRHAVALNNANYFSVELHMFGKFGVFHNGRAVDFRSFKAKELFALCADHCGADVTIEEAADKLWSERPYDEKVKGLYRKAVMNIRRTMDEHNIENVFFATRGSCKINPTNIKCDYYRYKSAPLANIQLYNGEYLNDYSWAEEKAATLHFQKENLLSIIKDRGSTTNY